MANIAQMLERIANIKSAKLSRSKLLRYKIA